LILSALALCILIVGCGGSTHTHPVQAKSSSLNIIIHWPEESRFIHTKANKVVALVVAPNGDEFHPVLGEVERPQGGGTSTLTISPPSGPVILRLKAIHLESGTPTVLSQGQKFIVLLPGVNDPLSIDLDSMTATIEVARVPQKDTYFVGDTFQLVPTAYNAEGSIVLNEGQDFNYSSEMANIASVSSAGLVTILEVGTTQLTVSEAGSGVGGKSVSISATSTEPTWQSFELHPGDSYTVSDTVGISGGRIGGSVGNESSSVVGYWTLDPVRWIELESMAKATSISSSAISGFKVIPGQMDTPAGFTFFSPGTWKSLALQNPGMNEVLGSHGLEFVGNAATGNTTLAALADANGNVTLLGSSADMWSSASGTDGVQQVGMTNYNFSGYRATVWTGSLASRVDLHPSSASGNSRAFAVQNGKQVGFAEFGGTSIHALLWSSGPNNYIDLHPTHLSVGQSSAVAMDGGWQAGWIGEFAGPRRAVIWQGTAMSCLDLHQYLDEKYSRSEATGIWVSGNATYVSGGALNAETNRWEAMAWKKQ